MKKLDVKYSLLKEVEESYSIVMAKHSGSDVVYGMGVVGALVYNIQYADGFSEILWGIVKSLLWPGFIVYELLLRMQI